jgi:Flavin containing amine oxidoreductase
MAQSTTATTAQVTTLAQDLLTQMEPNLPLPHETVERQGDALDVVHRPELPLLLLLLETRPVHQLQRLRKGAAGKIHFAGEHCSQDVQGFMEGGASEGLRAASEILAELKTMWDVRRSPWPVLRLLEHNHLSIY